MKKHSIAASAVGAVMIGSLSAQSLFDLAPDDATTDSLPLTYTAGANIGYDDNPTPLIGNDDSSLYGQAYIGATYLNNTPQTTLSFGAQVGVIHYFDNLDVLGTDVDDTAFTATLYLNWTRRISERLRFVSRNNITYELEPDYSVGFQAQRQIGNYLRWSTDNAVGYRWSERFATYTGIRFSGITFLDDFSGGDREFLTVYNDFRYQVSDRTVATLSYRYQDVSGDAQVTDAVNQFILVGIEHRFSPRSTAVVRAGAQIRDVDNGNSGTSPYLEASVNTQVNESFSFRGYARYGVEDFQRALQFPGVVGNTVYSDTDTLRIGVTGTYQLSQQVSFTGGINYAFLDFNEIQSGTGPSSIEEELLNAFIGVDYQLNEAVRLNARYNFEDLSSDAGRDYDRNRISIGASTTF